MISIIIPVYNEEKTIESIISSVNQEFNDIPHEIIVINDGSNDKTHEICISIKDIKYIKFDQNMGKGFALREGFSAATGIYVAIQDADMEYKPKTLRKLFNSIEKDKVIYGMRDRKSGYYFNRIGNAFLSKFLNILYQSNLFDIYTCYKIIPNDILKSLNLTSNRFEIEAEITAKLLRKKIPIIELPIDYSPRKYHEGKHIRPIDGLIGIWTILKNRI
ncbi:MAG: glycosyltransferase family 2 protein [Candidatus Paceibacterota bacterium]